MMETWKTMAPRARAGIVAGCVLIAGFALALGLWAYRADYQVLFADVAPADAAAMTAELDRMKTPYQLADGGNTILVPKDLVYKTRLQLMGKELPLHGAVGFEVFNNADFGMTEFVQKVNYLRAIQGELTRTILSIEDIQAARVHLALPEQGLFKKAIAKPKASVTLTMKNGRVLAPEQVAGIQRLVAASVPDIASADVTVLNQHGVALTRPVQADAAGEQSGTAQLDTKRSTEEYLAKKVTQVLERTFGPGEAVASVDVALNLDQSKVTTEEVLPAKGGAADGVPAGVVVRERQTTRDGAAALGAPAGVPKAGAGGGTTTESDYQVGRRVEHLVPASGTVRRMTIAVLVRQPLREDQVEKLKEVVSLAVGFNSARGDAVVVHSMDQFAAPVGMRNAADAATAAVDANAAAAGSPAAAPAQAAGAGPLRVAGVLAAVLAAITLTLLAYHTARGRRRRAVARLDPAARQQLLQDIRTWIATPSAPDGPGSRP
ncbi:flagellar basal-body MS-ring/collar protein FliF [Pseudoduganella namucuonensis]|nr:flagellar basal-body MS-ring/collar protein FliF [Pseudoduganella namucuonensis]